MANFRIRIASPSQSDVEKKIKEKLAEGYTLVNKGSTKQYYGSTYFAYVEKPANEKATD